MTAHITQSLDQTPGSFDSTAENSDSNGSRGRRVCYPAYQSAPRGLLWGKSPMMWRAEVLPLPCPLLNLVHSVSMASPWRRGGCYSLTPSVGIVSSVRSGKACLLGCLRLLFHCCDKTSWPRQHIKESVSFGHESSRLSWQAGLVLGLTS